MISVRPEPLMVPDPLNDSITAILAAEADPLIVDSNDRISVQITDGLNNFRGSTSDFVRRAVDGSRSVE